jgi:type I restriction enzyme S subunit
MASEWRPSTWGQEISLEYGKALRSYDSENGKYRVFGSNGPIGWTEQPLSPGPGVILGRKGAYRGVQYSAEPFFVIDTAYYVVPKTDLDMRWLYYAIRHYKLGEVDDGSPIPSTTRAAVYVLDVEVPPVPEQRAIAHVLGKLDDKIELNRRMNETLGAMARAIFKSWFADPADDGLPLGWRFETLGNLADVNWGDTSVTKASYTDEGFAAYSASGRDGYLPYYDFDRTGIVVSAIGANAGVSWLALGKWSCIKNTLRFWATAQNVSTEYLFYATLGKENWPLRGSAQPFISQGDARGIQISVPSDNSAIRFGEITQTLHLKIKANEEESRTLAALRDTLLPQLLSGEFRIKDPERIIAEHIRWQI